MPFVGRRGGQVRVCRNRQEARLKSRLGVPARGIPGGGELKSRFGAWRSGPVADRSGRRLRRGGNPLDSSAECAEHPEAMMPLSFPLFSPCKGWAPPGRGGGRREIRESLDRRPKSRPAVVPGDVAQLGEHLLCTQGVAGSSPVISTSTLTTEQVRKSNPCRPPSQSGSSSHVDHASELRSGCRQGKLRRVQGGCLGTKRRRRTRLPAKCLGELEASDDPGISEWGNPPGVMPRHSRLNT